MSLCLFFFFFFKQKTAYEMRISDWSSDVCSSDLPAWRLRVAAGGARVHRAALSPAFAILSDRAAIVGDPCAVAQRSHRRCRHPRIPWRSHAAAGVLVRSEEHTSELQSLMRISYAVFCLKKKTKQK